MAGLIRSVGPLVLGVALLSLVGCGDTATDQPRPAPAQDAAVVVRTFQFNPSPTMVPVGTRVTWTNQDDTEHTVTSGTPDARDGRIDGVMRGKDATFTFTVLEPGTYAYFCSRHDSMRGEVRVH